MLKYKRFLTGKTCRKEKGEDMTDKNEDGLKKDVRLERLTMIAQTPVAALEEFIQAENPGAKRLEMLIQNTQELQMEIRELFEKYSYERVFLSEEHIPNKSYGLDKQYNAIHPAQVGVELQLVRLQNLFPNCAFIADTTVEDRPLHPLAEGYVVVPHYTVIAPSYLLAVERVLAILFSVMRESSDVARMRPNQNRRYFESTTLRSYASSNEPWKKELAQNTKENTYVIPFQFGRRHAGRSPRRARVLMKENEVLFGVYATIIALLTHPNRLQSENQLGLYCLGDECAIREEQMWKSVVSFEMNKGLLLRETFENASLTISGFGAITGFLQSPI